jgi:glycosyltransferase involved in cell wall biosynthesis
MSKAPSIALCIPAYNAAAYLPRLLHSAAAQKIPFDEILVYNDCSKDDTAGVAESLGARVITGERNVGCSAGKNAMLYAVTSEWIHFHDADDELLPNFTTLAHAWLAKPEMPDVLLFDYEYRDNETKELIASSYFSSERLRTDPVEYAILTQINPFCGLYRKSRLQEVGGYDLDPEILYNDDVAFHCKLAIEGLSFDAEKEVSIINYRISGSMSGANQMKCLKAQHAVMRRVAAQVGSRYPEPITRRLWAIAGSLAAYGEWREMDQALDLASSLHRKAPMGQNPNFQKLASVISPKTAFRLREQMIRVFKPGLRKH